jgi:hypothetical protein
MIRNDAATAPKPAGAVSAVFPGSPTVTHSMIPALAIEPNGRQAKTASQREKDFKEKYGIRSILLISGLGLQSHRAAPTQAAELRERMD